MFNNAQIDRTMSAKDKFLWLIFYYILSKYKKKRLFTPLSQ
ncbi:hypothetical protein CNEO3_360009 [Clostridium neonatale]|nr:hypothetical protein CNEO4_270009 [Clostridium neonatale]CAI3643513.1 hypothetical protein CNEO3_360009 [Clostridium neonatale]CAI3713737.1 hypothetical protein CNEO3_360009 [Clostridium neonatale]